MRSTNFGLVAMLIAAALQLPSTALATPLSAVSPGTLLHTFLSPDRPTSQNAFGSSIFVDGDSVFIGDPFTAAGGSVYQFNRQGTLLHTYNSPAVNKGARFGTSMSVVNGRLLVGAPFEQFNGSSSAPGCGAVFVYNANTGALERRLDTTNPSPFVFQSFGNTLSTLGGNVVVGDANFTVDVFNPATGQVVRQFHNPSSADNTSFGAVVLAVGGNVLIAAGQQDHTGPGATGSGVAYLFDGGTGNLIRTIGNNINTAHGLGAAFANVGDNVLIGQFYTGLGAAYLVNPASGNVLRTFSQPPETANSWYGPSVAAIGNLSVVGAVPFQHPGAAYIYDSSNGNLLQTIHERPEDDGRSFAHALAAWEGNLLIGAPDGANGRSGVVYLYSTVASVPEPSSLLLAGVTGCGLLGYARSRMRKWTLRQIIPAVVAVLSVLLDGNQAATAATMVHQWKFDNNLIDTSGSSNTGVFGPASAVYVPGKFGPAVNFAANQKVSNSAPTNLPLLKNDPWSINLWANYPTSPVEGAYLGGIGDRNNAAGGNKRALIQYRGHIYFWGSDDDYDTGVAFPPVNQWHMYTMTYDGSNLKMFLDAVNIGSVNRPLSANAQGIVSVGGIPDFFGGSYVGKIDDFTIWRGTLLQSEINGLLTASVPEPSAIVLAGVGLVLLVGCVCRKRLQTARSLRLAALPMRAGIVALVGLAANMLADDTVAAPIHWPVSSGGNGHYYDFVSIANTWEQSKAFAEVSVFQGHRGQLVSITSAAENEFVTAHLGPTNYWIGLTDSETYGGTESAGGPRQGWVWLTGEPVNYVNWNSFEPNNEGNNEDTAEIYGTQGGGANRIGFWNDEPANHGLGYIVEFGPAVPEPSSLVHAAVGGIGMLMALCRRSRGPS